MILPSRLVFPQFLFFSFFFFLVSFFSSFLSSLLLPSLFLLLSSCELTTVSLTASRGICLRHSRLLLSNSCKGLRPPLVSTSECNNKMSILKKKKKMYKLSIYIVGRNYRCIVDCLLKHFCFSSCRKISSYSFKSVFYETSMNLLDYCSNSRKNHLYFE